MKTLKIELSVRRYTGLKGYPWSILTAGILVFLVTCQFGVAATRGISLQANNARPGSVKSTNFKALLIAIDNYHDERVPNLETAVHDAQGVKDVLENYFGFTTKLLVNENATRRGIDHELRSLVDSAEPHDSILIYYAGHGEIDRQYNDGWWIPTDAVGGDPTTYLDNTQVQKAMRAMAARHVLLISDSCYSGTLFGTTRSIPRLNTNRYYRSLAQEKSRWGITSGNKEPVNDEGSEGHSVFAYHLIKALRQYEKPIFSTQDLYTSIAALIANNSEQTPICRPIRNTGDEGGEFIFVRTEATEDMSTSISETIVTNRVENRETHFPSDGLGRSQVSPDRTVMIYDNGHETQKIMPHYGQQLEIQQEKDANVMDNPSRFQRGPEGQIIDTVQQLVWAPSISKSFSSWRRGKYYCKKYRGGGNKDWRLPTLDELKSLYQGGQRPFVEGKEVLIDIDSSGIWANERDSTRATLFYFQSGDTRWVYDSDGVSQKGKVLPVRKMKH